MYRPHTRLGVVMRGGGGRRRHMRENSSTHGTHRGKQRKKEMSRNIKSFSVVSKDFSGDRNNQEGGKKTNESQNLVSETSVLPGRGSGGGDSPIASEGFSHVSEEQR